MPNTGKGGRIRDPLEEGEDKSQQLDTSGNREESMTESGEDAFGKGSAVRNPDTEEQGDGSGDETTGKSGAQRSASSGTTPLAGESRAANERTGPGGVEGESGTA